MTVETTSRVLAHELTVFRRQWHGFVFTALVQPVLYLASMGVGLGSYVDSGTGDVGGVSYLEFVAPGLLAASAFQFAVGFSLWPVMGGWKWDKRYLAMLATPLTSDDIVDAHLSWQALQVGASSVVFVAVAALLGALATPLAVLAVPAAVLLAAAVAAIVGAWSAAMEEDRYFPVVMRIGVLPLFLFSGTFFPTSELPAALRVLAPLSPLYHGVELARAATTGQAASGGVVVVHLAVLLGMLAAGRAAARHTFRRRLSA